MSGVTMLFIVSVCALAALAHAQLQVNTTQGVIVGSNALDGNYYTFYGIHYAGFTSGENRFKPPTPAPRYPGEFHAIDNNIICAQPSSRGLIGVEDCLVLNVFTNKLETPKPVIVWIVNEEYSNTDSTIKSFKTFVEQGIVVVQLNYRLSIFGFLCLGVADAPGNAGLKDIVQGLQWINQNIAGFGGDPNNVVLFGHGSGAAMVDMITMSPLATGLVHKAIALSGSALAPWAVAYEPIRYADAFGEKLGYTGKSTEELAKLLAGSDINIMANALNEFEFTNNSILFAPCIENPKLNGTFLSDAPINILRSGNYSQIPYIAGYTDLEGTLRAHQAAFNNWLLLMQTNFTKFLPVDLDLRANQTAVENSIKEYYFGQKAITFETIEDFLAYEGDVLVLVSVVRGVRERALTSSSPVRLLEFAFNGTQNSDWVYTNIPLIGARHGSILNFILAYDTRPNFDDSVTMSLVGRITGFAKTGTPSGGVSWEPVTGSLYNYLWYGNVDMSSNNVYHREERKVNPHQQRMAFWDNLYSKYYKMPTTVSGAERLIGTVLVFLGAMFVTCF